ncbi:aminoacylase-1-like [Schistocerca cancellata]|uniref:aminoacylase-1-like n=1 Tax=Schistocerca cancellata TaxID=274614 RepID=UPI002118DF02|nr:aminoacylase-1-like [Schistocerca cancellata]
MGTRGDEITKKQMLEQLRIRASRLPLQQLAVRSHRPRHEAPVADATQDLRLPEPGATPRLTSSHRQLSSTQRSPPIYADARRPGKVKVRCRGFTGHGSILVPGTPGEKLRIVLDRFMDFRQEELDKLQQDPNLWMADVTSTNLTTVEGGSALNVIPPEMSAVFDLRLNPLMDFDKLEEKIRQWCSDAGEGVELEFLAKQEKVPTTLIGADNKWWTAFQEATEKLEMKIKPLILPATSDARFIRRAGIPALGFMPINNTPILPHGIDEYITAASLLRGIDIFQGVLQEVANVL